MKYLNFLNFGIFKVRINKREYELEDEVLEQLDG